MVSISRRAFLAIAALVPAMASAQSKPAVSLQEFMELSSRLVGRPKLDPDVGQIYLNALVADPDNAIYLATLVASNGNPTPEQRVLSQTIIEWWYTGVYRVAGKPQLATHSGALMWNAMDMPAPGTCVGPFGAWSKPPRSRVRRPEALAQFRSALSKIPECPYPDTPYAQHPVSDNPDHYYLQDGADKFASPYLRQVGGTTWHWLGTTLRFVPDDFRLRSKFGVAMDWPITYDQLEPF